MKAAARAALAALLATLGVASAAAMLSCGEVVPLGGAAKTIPPPTACSGKACGETCALGSACPDGGCAVAEPAGYCDESGACNTWLPDCAYNPCEKKSCGEACSLHSADNPALMTEASTLACTGDGKCVPAPVTCGPCDGKLCGEWCDPCGGDPTCAVPFGPTLCDATGACVPAEQVTTCSLSYHPCFDMMHQCGSPCSPCDPMLGNCVVPPIWYFCDDSYQCVPYQHACTTNLSCEGMPCGTQCTFCDYKDAACTANFCDGAGQCVPPENLMCSGTDPCAGKQCGDSCALCPAGTADCSTSAQALILTCDANGLCTDQPVMCPQNGPSVCTGKNCGVPCDLCDPMVDPMCSPMPAYCTADGQCVAGAPMCPPL